MQSGSKLVLGIFGLALAAGVISWWYRYEAAHRSTTFWGPHFAELIARPSDVTAFGLEEISSTDGNDESLRVLDKSYHPANRKDITKTPGLVHLRNAILSDSNYHWDHEIAFNDWRWCLQFVGDGRKATLLFDEDFAVLGRLNQRGDNLRIVDCQPMAETLRDYFASSGIFNGGEDGPPQNNGENSTASKTAE